jgi:hypothetical protein
VEDARVAILFGGGMLAAHALVLRTSRLRPLP